MSGPPWAYESEARFSRESKRLFGQSPAAICPEARSMLSGPLSSPLLPAFGALRLPLHVPRSKALELERKTQTKKANRVFASALFAYHDPARPHVSREEGDAVQENGPGIAGASGSGSFFRQRGKGECHGSGGDHPAAGHYQHRRLSGQRRHGLAEGQPGGWPFRRLYVNAIEEVLIQLQAYAGFPHSLTAPDVFLDLPDARRASGITDKSGPAPRHLPPDADRLALGFQ